MMFNFRKKGSAKDFWAWFLKNEDTYYRLNEDMELPFEKLNKKLTKVHPDLTFEFSAELSNGRRDFVISADGFKDAFPHVIELVDHSPLDKNRWNLYAFRQRTGLNEIKYQNARLRPENIYFTYRINQGLENKEVDIDIYLKEVKVNDESIGAAFIFLDNFIGEYDVVTKLGQIEFHEYQEQNGDLLSIEKLEDIVDSL